MAGLICPKCEFEQAPGPVCEACGIVFAKWGEMARRSATPHKTRTITPLPEPRSVTPPATPANLRLTVLLVVFVLLSGGVIARQMYEVRRQAAGDAVDKELRVRGEFFEPGRAGTDGRLREVTPLRPDADRPQLLPPSSPGVARASRPENPIRLYPRDERGCGVFTAAPEADEAGVGPAASPESPAWREGLAGWEAGRKEQDRTGAPLLALLVPDRCALCRQLRRDVLERPTMAEILRRFIKVRVTPGSAPKAVELARQLGVKAREGGPPELLLLASPDRVPLPIPVIDEGAPGPRPVSAARLLQELTDRLRKEAAQLVLLGYELQRLPGRDNVQAERVLNSALRLDAHNSEAWFWRGSVRRRLGHISSAIADLRVAGALDPSHPNAWAELGGIAIDRRCYEEGIVYASRLLDASPTPDAQGRARGLRAQALAGLGWRKEAAKEAEIACQLGHRPSCDGVRL